MPCGGSELNPTKEEHERQRIGRCMAYLLLKTMGSVSDVVKKQAASIYGEGPYRAEDVCSLLLNLNEGDREALIYEARDPESRHLADWWEDHQQQDRAKAKRADEAARNELHEQDIEWIENLLVENPGITHALRALRDAAKQQERERIRKAVEQMESPYYDNSSRTLRDAWLMAKNGALCKIDEEAKYVE